MPAKKRAAKSKAGTIAKKKTATTKTAPPKHRDLEALQGTWHITSLEMNGASAPDVAFTGATITVRGKKFISSSAVDRYTGIIQLDETRTPRAVDLVFDSGPQTGVRNLGIYELDGDDWRFCIDMGGVNRPKRFATQPESGLALETLRRGPAPRTRSAKSPRPATKSRGVTSAAAEPRIGEPTEIDGEWAMVSAVFGGKPLSGDMVAYCKRITRGSVTKIMAGPQVMLDASFELDTSSTPRRIDYVNRSGANKGKQQAGIYAIDGETLRINVAAPGDQRPNDFVSLKGDGRSFTVWKRSAI